MKKVADYLRVREWIDSKVTMILGIAAYFLCLDKADIADWFQVLIVYFLFLSMFLALSYVFNDYTDLEIDKKAGKTKVIASVPKWLIYVSFTAMILIGDVPILLLVEKKILCLCVIVFITIFGLAYSFPGIRFKERGALGLVECSFAQRCFPLVLILFFVDLHKTDLILWGMWFALSFIDGLRYILIHQYIDRENDRNTRTHTFVLDKQVNIRKTIVCLCLFETVICAALLAPLAMEYPVIVAIGVVICALLEFCIYKVLNVFAKKDWMVSFDSVPLESFLNIIMPVMVGICMMKTHVWAGIFVVFILVCCIRAIKAKKDIVAVYIDSRISG